MPRRPPDPKIVAPGAEDLAERLIACTRVLGKNSARSQFGPLSAARYEVLHIVFHAGPLTMSDVAGRLGVSPRTVTDLVDGLETDRYVERTGHPTDRRKTVLTLTERGLDALGAARRVRLADAAVHLAVLDPAERTTLAALLDKVIAKSSPDSGV